ncbi:MAG: hypothetical protein RMK20_13990 [Verrucomicrobiales bacterium]|nr:hypothetical protein [Verrucomicrobiales bacterium]
MSAAFQLIEVMVYIAMLWVLLAVAYVAFDRALWRSEALRRSADDITRALRAGERWRADVRAATGPIRVERTEDGERLWIPGPRGLIAYERMTNALVRREAGASSALLLTRVRASTMSAEPRDRVTVWRWELELQPPTKRPASVRPLFTFLAVPERSASP